MYFSDMRYARTNNKENSQGSSLARKHQAGFTLLELVILIIIISILAAVAIPIYIDMSQNAEQASFNDALQSINTANTIYSMGQIASGLTITAQNPFDNMTISNYAGSFGDVESTNCPPGYWAYQSGDADLNNDWAVIVYRLASTVPSQYAYTWDGIQWIIYTEAVVPDQNGNPIGLELTPYSSAQW